VAIGQHIPDSGEQWGWVLNVVRKRDLKHIFNSGNAEIENGWRKKGQPFDNLKGLAARYMCS
jgi:hypothetical protein